MLLIRSQGPYPFAQQSYIEFRYFFNPQTPFSLWKANNLPIYLLSVFKIPQKVARRLVALQRNFLWGGDKDYKKISGVKWEVICLPKAEGGLGIKEISKFNEALLDKWIWALASD